MLCKCTAFGKKDDVSQIEESRVSEKALQQFICLQGFVFKPKYWAICLKKKKNIYIYIYIYIHICFILFFTSSSPCRKDQFAVSYFSTGLIVLIQVYNSEIRHHSLVCYCGLADVLYTVKFRK